MSARQGEVWQVDFNPTRGREQSGIRPAVVISVDRFNSGSAELAIVVAITTTPWEVPFHVRIAPPEGGQDRVGYAMADHVRSVSVERLIRRRGRVSPETLRRVVKIVRLLTYV